jgi:hypothetical protein
VKDLYVMLAGLCYIGLKASFFIALLLFITGNPVAILIGIGLVCFFWAVCEHMGPKVKAILDEENRND